MNRKIISGALAALLSVSAIGSAALADDSITVMVNANNIHFEDAEPFIENGHTLVPMRAIFEALGTSVRWDDETKTVTAKHNTTGTVVVMQIGSDIMKVDDQEVVLETPAMIVEDRTVVPVRAIAEGLGSPVDWDGETRTVYVGYKTTPESSITNAAPVIDFSEHWTDYNDFSALNSAAGFNVPALNLDGAEPYVYRYSTEQQIAEVIYQYEIPEEPNSLSIRKDGSSIVISVRKHAETSENISGISGGAQDEEYSSGGITIPICTYQSTVYGLFDKDGHSYCVSVQSSYVTPQERIAVLEDAIDRITASI